MVHFGPFSPEEGHFGPFRSANRTLAIPEIRCSDENSENDEYAFHRVYPQKQGLCSENGGCRPNKGMVHQKQGFSPMISVRRKECDERSLHRVPGPCSQVRPRPSIQNWPWVKKSKKRLRGSLRGPGRPSKQVNNESPESKTGEL